MKLTNLHIFLIILLALVLCSTLGGTCSREGYGTYNQTYHSYKNFYKDLDNETTGGLSGNTTKTKHHRHHQGRHHRQHQGQYHNRENYKNNNSYGNDDMNGGDYSDPSAMFSGSYKTSHNKHANYDSAYRRERTSNKMFDSVSNGAINGSLFNSANSYSTNYDNGNGDDYSNGDDNGNGVSGNQIPSGQEDLYILKSQMVPPICPACPKCPSVNCDDKCGNNKCPPCPACARCPEPQFECKKVPNYSSANIMGNLPIPWADKLDLN